MKYQTHALCAALLLLICPHIAFGQCNQSNLVPVSTLEKRALVIDVRPDQINQFRGKSTFKDEARIALVNMNPFLFSYRLKVDQTEIQDTGFLNFLNLLGSPITDLMGSAQSASRNRSLSATDGGNLALLIRRTNGPVSLNSCRAEKAKDAGDDPDAKAAAAATLADAEVALVELARVRGATLDKLDDVRRKVRNMSDRYLGARAHFLLRKDVIFNSSSDAASLCDAADHLLNELKANHYPDLDEMKETLTDVRDFRSLVEELKSSATDFKTEYESCPARAGGLGYADNLMRLATELGKLGEAFETQVSSLIDETKGYDALKQTIAKLDGKEAQILQREYPVMGQYDISALDITVTPEPLGADSGLPVRRDLTDPRFDVVGSTQAARQTATGQPSAQGNVRIVNVGATDSGGGVKVFAPHAASFRARAQAEGSDGGGGGGGTGGGGGGDSGGGDAGTTAIRHSRGVIGARRFELSGGMAFSSLDRREFQTVLGYPRNANGEIIDPESGQPTNDRKLSKIVGVSEASSRRFAPLGMLHYRLPNTTHFFASVGFTGKRDDYGVDLEYLLGPSVLYKNMFFTFGGYAGKQQKLAGDLYEGAPIDGDVPVRKDYKWGAGFSFTYKIPLGNDGKPKN